MEKLEETEIKRRISIKAAVVLISSLVLYFGKWYYILLKFHCWITYGTDCLSHLPDGLSLVWVHIQAGQDHIQQIPSLYLLDSNNVCPYFLDGLFPCWALYGLYLVIYESYWNLTGCTYACGMLLKVFVVTVWPFSRKWPLYYFDLLFNSLSLSFTLSLSLSLRKYGLIPSIAFFFPFKKRSLVRYYFPSS